MSGPGLGETLKQARPDMHVMLMSAGAKGSLLVLNYGWAFIPIHSEALSTGEASWNGHECIAQANRPQLGGQEFDRRKDISKYSPHRRSASRRWFRFFVASDNRLSSDCCGAQKLRPALFRAM
jgi:hypothetical protein